MSMPYLLRRMQRRKKMCVIVGLSAFIAGALVFGFHIGSISMSRQVEEVIDNSIVTCAVTNLTGTQQDGLMLPDWAANLFRVTTSESVHVPKTSFMDYVKDVRMKFSMEAVSPYGSVQIFGATSIYAERSVTPQENMIDWLDGFDDSLFESDAEVCVVSDDLYKLLQQSGSNKLVLSVKARNSKERTADLTLTVAGVIHGKSESVYCPWAPASKVCLDLNGHLNVDCISATIKDNRRIDEFKEKCASVYFASVDPRGVPQPWEASPIYDSYPYALEVYDQTLNETVRTLENGMTVFQICQIAVVILTLGMGFIVGNLSVKHRQKELALQNVLGLPRSSIYSEVFVEFTIVSFSCLAVGVAILAIIFRESPPWLYVVAVLAASCLGVTTGAMPILTNKDILLMAEKE